MRLIYDVPNSVIYTSRSNYYSQDNVKKIHRMKLIRKFTNLGSLSFIATKNKKEDILQVKPMIKYRQSNCDCGECFDEEYKYFDNVGEITTVQKQKDGYFRTPSNQENFIAINHLSYFKKIVVLSKLNKQSWNRLKISGFTYWIVWLLNSMDRVYYNKYW